MKKRLAAVALAISMTIGLAACGSSGGTGASSSAGAVPSAGTLAGSAAAASSETSAGAGSGGVLRVGMAGGYVPFDWLQNDDSNGAVPTVDGSYMNGYDIQIAKGIADSLGMELQVSQVEWNGLIMSITSGKIDCAIAGMSITSERKNTVDFTEPYYNANLCIITQKDSQYASADEISDFSGAKMTASMNTVWYDVLDQIDGVDKQPALSQTGALVSALTSKKVDAEVWDIPSAMFVVANNPDLVMLQFDDGKGFQVSSEQTDIGIPVRKGNTELVEKINAYLDTLTQDDRDKMMSDAAAAAPATAG